MARPAPHDLAPRLAALDLDIETFWLHYLACGGHGSEFELDALVCGALRPDDHEACILQHALWELETGLAST